MTKPIPPLKDVMGWVIASILQGCQDSLGRGATLHSSAVEMFDRRYSKSFDDALNVQKIDWWAAEAKVLETARKHGHVAGIIQSFHGGTEVSDISLVKAGHMIEIECKNSVLRGQFCW